MTIIAAASCCIGPENCVFLAADTQYTDTDDMIHYSTKLMPYMVNKTVWIVAASGNRVLDQAISKVFKRNCSELTEDAIVHRIHTEITEFWADKYEVKDAEETGPIFYGDEVIIAHGSRLWSIDETGFLEEAEPGEVVYCGAGRTLARAAYTAIQKPAFNRHDIERAVKVAADLSLLCGGEIETVTLTSGV